MTTEGKKRTEKTGFQVVNKMFPVEMQYKLKYIHKWRDKTKLSTYRLIAYNLLSHLSKEVQRKTEKGTKFIKIKQYEKYIESKKEK